MPPVNRMLAWSALILSGLPFMGSMVSLAMAKNWIRGPDTLLAILITLVLCLMAAAGFLVSIVLLFYPGLSRRIGAALAVLGGVNAVALWSSLSLHLSNIIWS